MKTLYAVRHGKTEANDKGVYQSEDSPLSKEGREQALILQKRFASIPIDVICTSPLPRAHETAEIINEKLRVPVETNDLLREWKKPSSFIGKSLKGEQAKDFENALGSHRDDLNWKYEDEESAAELRDRAAEFLEERKTAKAENTLVITHSVPLVTMLILVLLGKEENALAYHEISKNVSIANTSITVFRLREDSQQWRLITWNDYAHLGEL
ncbi:MAG: histidine phosphatase family protein [Candidatus Wildermuthbacteria bacterium]|nr:histidine phosphatase family protein [Candidatus Wildermuthbacteria bacterium]